MIQRTPIPTLFPYTTLFRSPKKSEIPIGPSQRSANCQVLPSGSYSSQRPQLRSRHAAAVATAIHRAREDRKSTRLNSSHLVISYAVFCLKKKLHNDTNAKIN